MTDQTVQPTCLNVELDGVAAVLQLNRTEKHNALSAQLVHELTAALRDLDGNPAVRAVLLIGSPRAFSTGVDLAEALEIETEERYREASARWRGLTEAIEGCSKPVIACISGYCLTGGLEVAMACDIRIAESDAQLGITSARIGSVAGIGATQRLPRLVGRGRAKQLLFTAEYVDGQEARRIGLVDEVVPSGTVREAGMRLAASIARMAPLSVAWHKRAVDEGLDLPLEAGLDLEAELSKQAFMTEDKKEGMSAFLERRKPVFRGR